MNGERPHAKPTLVIEYDGSNYNGFQYQPQRPTVQGELERAIGKITGEEARVRGASRTDSGVHAAGQVVDFFTHAQLSEEAWTGAFNFHLPRDIRVREAHKTTPDFHPRRDAVARTYRYTILNRDTESPLIRDRCAWVRAPLDAEAMGRGAGFLVGTHDFSGFTAPLPPGKSGVRAVRRWEVWRDGDLVLIEAEANAFMLHQIVRTNGMLVDIGKGRTDPSAIQDMTNGRIKKGRQAASLPAKGLCLMRVEYRNFPPKRGNQEDEAS